MNPQSNKDTVITSDSKEYIIPVEGSLGLLALGASGLKAWRKVKQQAKGNKPAQSSKSKTT